MKLLLAFLAGLGLGVVVVLAIRPPRRAAAGAVEVAAPAPAASLRPGPSPIRGGGPPGAPAPPAAGPDARVLEALHALGERLDALDLRLAGLERRPAVHEPGDSDLRGLVEAVLIEARDAQRAREEAAMREEAARSREASRAEIRFHAGLVAAQAGEELGLSQGQRDVLVEALSSWQERQRELERGIDPGTTDPTAWRREIEDLEADFWSGLEANLGPALTARLREHF